MLRLIVLAGNALAVTLLLSACSAAPQSPTPTGPASAKKIGEPDNGSTVTLHTGDQLDITLAANPTTGYQWEIAAGDAAVVKLVGGPEYAPGGSALGSGGKTTFHFEAVAPGQTTLKLIYHRPFEKNTPPVNTFEVTVVVK